MIALLPHRSNASAIDSSIAAEFGLRLRSLREQARLGRDEFARRTGLTPGDLHLIETGQIDVDLFVLDTLSKALKLPICELLEGL